MASTPPSHAPSASMSRSKTSRDDRRSQADSMLRSALSATGSDSSTSSTPTTSPSHHSARRHNSKKSSSTSTSSSLLPGLNSRLTEPSKSGRERPCVDNRPLSFLSRSSSATASLTCDQLHTAESDGGATQAKTPEPRLHPKKRNLVERLQRADSAVAGSPSRMTAAEAKQRVRELQREVDRASAASPQRSTAGLFKAVYSTDLLFLIDTTGSMTDYIDAAKEQVKGIMNDIKEAFLNEADVRIAVVGYKDHGDTPNIQFLDFTPSADRVRQFLNQLEAIGGDDTPEDVLGGIQQAINASWDQQSRCIVHIADAPPHGRMLHNLARDSWDNYIEPGSEPHGLLHEPLLRQLIQLKINYALLHINSSTDRMASAFSHIYAAAGADIKLLSSNTYLHDGGVSDASTRCSASAGLQFEELQLGAAYSTLRHLVLKTATSSASRTANRLSSSLSSLGKAGAIGGRSDKLASNLDAIDEDVPLEKVSPEWETPGWLDETLVVEGFCPDIVVHSGSTLNDMMALDENIKLSVVELTIYARSKPFSKGALRTSSYARTAASTDRFVVKSFIKSGKGIAHLAEDLRCQALCKAFALEFNALLEAEHSIDFIVTACLQGRSGMRLADRCISLEPLIGGEYVKYNSNCGYVNEDEGQFNQTAQAFSHFTFERSYGHFLITDLQGAGPLLTDPSVQTLDEERFKLNDTNVNQEGFKFFFATHVCNSICRKLKLKSNREMVMSGNYDFRERWPSLDSTVCCSNKLCRRIIRLASAQKSDDFPGHQWCDTCWPQLESSTVEWICIAPGPYHEFNASKFFYESQGQPTPHTCPEHRERDTTVSGAAVVGGSLWNRMKSSNQKRSISGRSW